MFIRDSIEPAAGNAVVGAQAILARDREAHLMQPRLDLILAVSYTHLRAHETVLDLVCRLLLAKKNNSIHKSLLSSTPYT